MSVKNNCTAWVLEGLTVTGLYLGSIPVEGKIRLSRVKYGGTVSHHLDIIKPVEVYGALRDSIILDNDEILTIKG